MRDIISVRDDSEHSDYLLAEYGPKLIWLLRDLYPGNLTINGNVCDSETYFEYKIHENYHTEDFENYGKEKLKDIVKIKQYLLKIFRDKECFDI